MRRLEEAGVIAREGNELLEDIVRWLKRFVVFQMEEEAEALALYVIHTHALEASYTTPYMWFTSPAPTSGKTRATEALEPLVFQPLRASNASTSAIFRAIEKDRPTLILDEIDTALGPAANKEKAEDLRGLVNSGFNRGAGWLRCDGPKHEPRMFDTYCPKVLAGLGSVPDTIARRVVPIRLQRKSKAEKVERFRRRVIEGEAEKLRGEIAAWASAHLADLQEAWPSLPEELGDREQDGWESLLAIADAVGGDWAKRARAAAIKIHTGGDTEEGIGVQLLAHMKEALGEADRITTEALLKNLVARDDAPWAVWWGDKVEDGKFQGPASRLARIIKPFRIKSKTIKLPDQSTIKGFLAEDLRPVFERYLPPEKEGNDSEPPDPLKKSAPRNHAGQSVLSDGTEEEKEAPDQGGYDVTTFQGGVRERDSNPVVHEEKAALLRLISVEDFTFDSDHAAPCVVCGKRCIATDPDGHIRHPACVPAAALARVEVQR
ncbi:MAG: DUF3631 domain-containing protein [Actinomycetota bacterium]|nr:DUF3631 domain-containing protein [Actinomycetota bacterium]